MRHAEDKWNGGTVLDNDEWGANTIRRYDLWGDRSAKWEALLDRSVTRVLTIGLFYCSNCGTCVSLEGSCYG